MLAQILPSIEKLVIAATRILAILIASYAVYKLTALVIRNFIRLRTKRGKEAGARTIILRKRTFTLIALLQNVLKYFIFFIAVSLILDALGQNLLPLIAGAGIVGVALGFGAQSLVKDILAGFSILFEDQYAVGDFVLLTGPPTAVSGVVEEFGLRVTKIRDVAGTLHYVPNGTIVGVEKFSHGYQIFNIDLLLPTEVKEKQVEEVLKEMGEKLIKGQKLIVSSPQAIGLFPMGTTNLLRIQLKVIPSQEWVAEKLVAESISAALKQALGIVDIPVPTVYKIDEGALLKYKQSVSIQNEPLTS